MCTSYSNVKIEWLLTSFRFVFFSRRGNFIYFVLQATTDSTRESSRDSGGIARTGWRSERVPRMRRPVSTTPTNSTKVEYTFSSFLVCHRIASVRASVVAALHLCRASLSVFNLTVTKVRFTVSKERRSRGIRAPCPTVKSGYAEFSRECEK